MIINICKSIFKQENNLDHYQKKYFISWKIIRPSMDIQPYKDGNCKMEHTQRKRKKEQATNCLQGWQPSLISFSTTKKKENAEFPLSQDSSNWLMLRIFGRELVFLLGFLDYNKHPTRKFDGTDQVAGKVFWMTCWEV